MAHAVVDDVLFWGAGNEHGFLSQFFVAPFIGADGTRYICCEQYMMAEKARAFGDADARAAILAATKPADMKALGRKVRGFADGPWDAIKVAVVERGNTLKFSQHPDLAAALLATGDAHLAEASPMDAVWGIGTRSRDRSKWRGQNLLGIVLMSVRTALRLAAS